MQERRGKCKKGINAFTKSKRYERRNGGSEGARDGGVHGAGARGLARGGRAVGGRRPVCDGEVTAGEAWERAAGDRGR